VEYKSDLPNLERRWHCNFLIGDRYFVHGGWNDGGGLSDLIYLDLSTSSPLHAFIPRSIGRSRR
jgi:hypothetical protein